MCDKKSIRELREEAELRKLWHKANEIVDEDKTTTDILGRCWVKHSTGTEFQEDHIR